MMMNQETLYLLVLLASFLLSQIAIAVHKKLPNPLKLAVILIPPIIIVGTALINIYLPLLLIMWVTLMTSLLFNLSMKWVKNKSDRYQH